MYALWKRSSQSADTCLNRGKVFHGKIADVFGRAWDLTLCICLYALGFIVIASATTINAYAAGIIIYALGYTGLQIILQVIIADITTLRYRAFVSAAFSTPFFMCVPNL